MLSPEDVAWADSCLSTTDSLENGWDSLQDALSEALTAQSKDNSYEDVAMRLSSSSEETEYLDETITNSPGSSKRDQMDKSNGENPDDFWSRHKANDVFLPTYNEDSKDLGLSDPEMDFVFQAFGPEQTASDIFKVWDLNFPPLEEDDDDHFKQMDKPVAGSSSVPLSSVSDDAEAVKELKDRPVDDLICGIADLTLRRPS